MLLNKETKRIEHKRNESNIKETIEEQTDYIPAM